MIIEITEEEREFLERTCVRASLVCKMNLFNVNTIADVKGDMKAIEQLLLKLKDWEPLKLEND